MSGIVVEEAELEETEKVITGRPALSALAVGETVIFMTPPVYTY